MADNRRTCLPFGMLAALNPGMFILPVIIAIVVALLWAARGAMQKSHAQLRDFAQRHGLRVVEKSALGFTWVESLEGEQAGRVVRFWTFSTGAGKSRTTWVAVGVRPRADGGLTFDLARQGLGAKIMEFFGVKEIQVGDAAFDAAWFVCTNQPEFFAAALVPSIRARLMASPKVGRSHGYKLEKGVVQYAEHGHLSGEAVLARLEQQLPLLHELADVAEVFAGTGR
jgi:hypothetical protein